MVWAGAGELREEEPLEKELGRSLHMEHTPCLPGWACPATPLCGTESLHAQAGLMTTSIILSQSLPLHVRKTVKDGVAETESHRRWGVKWLARLREGFHPSL